ncbi:hypothetical protein EW146_g4105 [Bondarzewia mesenterica]|uniref:NADP-dependent oxidoreductase domain-containing protein n=1 Tax=Bondarzewia mesenterica TaxID=1095465 RepID=A0A4S4LW30_9AGAM|nr:hypothetical protein EW146_g4105 [Bondarzewia mesenterica]
MVQKTATIASNVVVAKTGHGLMLMTWKPTPVPDEEAFEAIKAGIDSLPAGTKMLINSAEFYGIDPITANLELIARFFERYPTYADKAFLSVKGSIIPGGGVDCSPENVRRSVDLILEKLRGTKKLDLFESARVDPKHPIEETMKVFSDLVAEGKFDYIGLSECSAETVRRASAVGPVAAVEIEVSPWSYTQETKDVIAVCKERGIAVVGYSPLGRGFLVGQIKKPSDFEGSTLCNSSPCAIINTSLQRNMKHNFAIVDALKAIADKKGITPAQLCIAWVAALGSHVIPLPGSSNKKRTIENLSGGDIELSADEIEEIGKVLETHPVMGGRYIDELGNDKLLLWG